MRLGLSLTLASLIFALFLKFDIIYSVNKLIFTMNYQDIITIEPGKRGGQPCIRNMRITVYDILKMLASGMSNKEIIEDFPELTKKDIQAALAYASEREHHLITIPKTAIPHEVAV